MLLLFVLLRVAPNDRRQRKKKREHKTTTAATRSVTTLLEDRGHVRTPRKLAGRNSFPPRERNGRAENACASRLIVCVDRWIATKAGRAFRFVEKGSRIG